MDGPLLAWSIHYTVIKKDGNSCKKWEERKIKSLLEISRDLCFVLELL